ncbi:glycosyltransferase family 1 protein [Rhizoctonia solani AG-1 IA]|uniref:Glycosyltransferase family 1 protein n=1 Tax=Thanatephorus cucumeris (strain AG1-IA) TaxID=983506 RepID=L8WY26_THACA|nr:glycosyltransferase family 1 protein [Rhizoctonia solani AG-1 IA]
MPWCATAAFPHPLVNVKQSGSHEPNAVNYYSYTLVDMLTWQGSPPRLGHAINKFRTKKLGLPYLSTASAVTMIQRSAIPWTYCISPALIPKPQDWLTHIGVILAGISQAGVRAIVSPGWGGLDETMVKAAGPHVFALGNAPHDWLFQHVSAVCHHGGAGTTAIGLKCGKPTIIVPFFGDQVWPTMFRKNALPHNGALLALTMVGCSASAAGPRFNLALRMGPKTEWNHFTSIYRYSTCGRCDLDPKRTAVCRGEWCCDSVLTGYEGSREYKTHASATDPISGTALPLLRVLNGFVHGVVKIGSSRPDKGVAKMVTSTVGGVQTVLQGVTEGLTNVPKLYGSEVRETKPVTGFASGIVEGGKVSNSSLARLRITSEIFNRGALGAAIGVGTGVLSFYMKPAAGFLQFFSMPMEGGVKDIRTLFTKGISQERIATRRAEGVLVVKQSSQEEQDSIIRAFAEHKDKTLRDRKGKGRMAPSHGSRSMTHPNDNFDFKPVI